MMRWDECENLSLFAIQSLVSFVFFFTSIFLFFFSFSFNFPSTIFLFVFPYLYILISCTYYINIYRYMVWKIIYYKVCNASKHNRQPAHISLSSCSLFSTSSCCYHICRIVFHTYDTLYIWCAMVLWGGDFFMFCVIKNRISFCPRKIKNKMKM